MPTVLDQFVISLSLDPSRFTQGQRQMAQNLRQMETGAERASKNIENSGSRVVSFFRALENPIGSLRQHFERLATVTTTPQRNLLNLAQQGRRTGQEVEAGALQGAAGLRAMGVAGLTAVAAFVALDKVRNSATETARNLFGASVGAAAAGVPIQQYTAISQALLHNGAVPEAETQGWLSQIRSAQIQAQHGDPSAANALGVNLSKAGVTGVNAYLDNPEQIMRAIADRFHSVSADVAIALGDMVGQSQALSLALHNLGASGLQEQIQLERQRSATEKQSQAAADLTKAQANLDVAWQSLERRVGEEIDPALTTFDNILADILDRLTGKQGAHILRDALLMLVPGGPAISAALHARDAAAGGNTAPNDTRNWWQRNAPTWAGGRTAPSVATSAAAPPANASDVDAIRSTVAAAGGNEQTQAAFLAMFSPEDPGLRASGTEEISGAGGVGGRGGASWAQWTASRRRQLEAFGWTGTDPVKDRIASAKMLYWELTTNKQFAEMVRQMNAAPSPADAAKIGGFTYEQGGSPASMFGYRGGETQAGLDAFHSRQAAHWYSVIQSAQNAQGSGNTTTHATSNDVDINGGIHVYGANTSDGYGVGHAISDGIKSQLLTNQINTGQE